MIVDDKFTLREITVKMVASLDICDQEDIVRILCTRMNCADCPFEKKDYGCMINEPYDFNWKYEDYLGEMT